jgi:hypothetical protein
MCRHPSYNSTGIRVILYPEQDLSFVHEYHYRTSCGKWCVLFGYRCWVAVGYRSWVAVGYRSWVAVGYRRNKHHSVIYNTPSVNEITLSQPISHSHHHTPFGNCVHILYSCSHRSADSLSPHHTIHLGITVFPQYRTTVSWIRFGDALEFGHC